MGSLGVLFDSTILIDYLNGSQAAFNEFRRYRERFISQMVWMEVMVKADAATEIATRAFLNRCTVLPVSDEIAERAVMLRRQRLSCPTPSSMPRRKCTACCSSRATRATSTTTWTAFASPTWFSFANI